MPHIGPNVTLDEPAFIHETAQIQGKVYIGKGVSVWTYAVTRSEVHEIRIGARTNIQDFVMIHEGSGFPTIVGAEPHVVVLLGVTHLQDDGSIQELDRLTLPKTVQL